MGATLLLFSSDWPLKFSKLFRFPVKPSFHLPRTTAQNPLKTSFVAFITLWTIVQIAMPWRNVFYDNEVRWTGQGHRFSWRMKIYDREASGYFIVKNENTKQAWVVDPKDYLSARQTRKMLVRPDMILQMAHHLDEIWAKNGHPSVTVHAQIQKSLNGRPFEDYVDMEQDLTVLKNEFFTEVTWLNSPGPREPLPQ